MEKTKQTPKTINVFKRTYDPFFSATTAYLIIMILFVGVRIFAQYGLLGFLGDYQDLAYSLLIQVVIIFGMSFLFYKLFTKKTAKNIFKEFRFKKISVKAVFLCIGIAICLIFFNTAFNSIYSLLLAIFGYAPQSSSITSYPLSAFLIALFASAILPGFCEEFANRGMLLSGLKNLGAKKAIIISGLLFGLMHLNVGQFGYAFLVGMFFAFVCLATGSIWPGIIMHFLNNAIVEYLSFAKINDLPFGNYYDTINAIMQADFLSSMMIMFVLLCCVMFLFAWMTYLLIKDTRGRKIKSLSNDIAESLAGTEIKEGMGLKISMPAESLGYDIYHKQTLFPSLKVSIPLYMSIFLGVVITIMTLIWNTL